MSLMEPASNFAPVARFMEHFFAVVENRSKRLQISLFLLNLDFVVRNSTLGERVQSNSLNSFKTFKRWTGIQYVGELIEAHTTLPVADQGEGPGGEAPLIFRPKWGPKGRKKFFWDRPPYLRVWMTAPPLIWRSGSATGFLYSYAVYS